MHAAVILVCTDPLGGLKWPYKATVSGTYYICRKMHGRQPVENSHEMASTMEAISPGAEGFQTTSESMMKIDSLPAKPNTEHSANCTQLESPPPYSLSDSKYEKHETSLYEKC